LELSWSEEPEEELDRVHYRSIQGASLPALGLGTFELRGVTCRFAVRHAIEAGYRHIDTAAIYENEGDVGGAIAESAVPREELFLTTKLWREDLSARGVRRQLEQSLRRLRTEYVDLLLVHWPNEEYPLQRTLAAMVEQQQQGRVRLLGVSNFPPSLVLRALEHVPICCNQVEYHPLLDQSRLLEQAREREMVLTAYSPLAQGRVLAESTIVEIARRREREPAQIVLRWLVQQEPVVAIPRSAEPEHIESNLRIFDFELDAAEMQTISRLARGERQIDPAWAPVWES
jgi:2,5-diketo-D-gluconate reductase B